MSYKKTTMDSFTGLRDISLTIYGLKKTIKGLSELTVCDDVIETVFDTLSISTIYASAFAIFESASGVERQLSSKTRVLKLIRSWGTDFEKYELIMRRADNVNENVNALSEDSLSSLSENDYYPCVRNESVNNITIAPTDHCYSEERKNKLKRYNACSKIHDCSKNYRTAKKLPASPESGGKMYIMKKYMADVMAYNNKRKRKMSTMQFIPRTPGDGSDLDITYFRHSKNDTSDVRKCDKGYSYVRSPGDREHTRNACKESLNNAFVCPNETVTDTTFESFDGMNEAFFVTGEDYLYESDTESPDAYKDVKSCEHVSSFGNNMNNIQITGKATEYHEGKYQLNGLSDNHEQLKHILGSVSSGTPSTSSSEDSLIESFMNTKLHEDKSLRQCM